MRAFLITDRRLSTGMVQAIQTTWKFNSIVKVGTQCPYCGQSKFDNLTDITAIIRIT